MIGDIVFFVEELSMEATLKILVPKILGNCPFRIINFQSKSKLLKNLSARLRGYRHDESIRAIIILVDRDNDDCVQLKEKLECAVESTNLRNKIPIINRIVIEELEAWFFGDWSAVRQAYERVKDITKSSKFRDSDAIIGGTWEALERQLNNAGYFREGLAKITCARSVASHMEPDRNRSKSFQVFYRSLLSFRGT